MTRGITKRKGLGHDTHVTEVVNMDARGARHVIHLNGVVKSENKTD
jgi:hypothetical protein